MRVREVLLAIRLVAFASLVIPMALCRNACAESASVGDVSIVVTQYSSTTDSYRVAYKSAGEMAICTETAIRTTRIPGSDGADAWTFQATVSRRISGSTLRDLVARLRELPWWQIPSCSEANRDVTNVSKYEAVVSEGGRQRTIEFRSDCMLRTHQVFLALVLPISPQAGSRAVTYAEKVRSIAMDDHLESRGLGRLYPGSSH